MTIDKLSKKQYGFKRGSSTTAAIHKVVRKLEMAMLNKGMTLSTFLDIEGAFDNVSFDSIEKALSKNCESPGVNRCIMSMIRRRTTKVELQGKEKVIPILRGCPQGDSVPIPVEPCYKRITRVHQRYDPVRPPGVCRRHSTGVYST